MQIIKNLRNDKDEKNVKYLIYFRNCCFDIKLCKKKTLFKKRITFQNNEDRYP